MVNGQPSRALLDTDLLRAYRRADPAAMAFLSRRSPLVRPEISQLSALCLLADTPDARARVGLAMFLSSCIIYPLNALTARRAHRLLDTLPAPSALTANDAIIAATALRHKLPLYTLDPGRFAGVAGLSTLPPY